MKVLVTGGSGFIGTHLVAHLVDCGYVVINVDCAKPRDESKIAIWRNCSILDKDALHAVFQEFQPQLVVHLAAYASMGEHSLDEFRPNTEGTANVLDACKETTTIERVVITSTQHVRRPGSPPPKSDTDYIPYMFYGESKVITEQLTRAANLKCAWTIIRPTAVWGPGHLMLADGLWKLMARGKYFHPSNDPVIRSYGYVKNVVWQIEKLLQTDAAAINGKVFYVADGNMRQYKWVNAFTKKLTGRDVRTVPVSCIHLLAKIGDGMKAVGLRFPMYSARFENLVTPNAVPVKPTLELLGNPPYTLDQGVEETAAWLKSYYRNRD
jgi:nucleoside-diphosphate-sugar epimerase